jgi:hypothetical protein
MISGNHIKRHKPNIVPIARIFGPRISLSHKDMHHIFLQLTRYENGGTASPPFRHPIGQGPKHGNP